MNINVVDDRPLVLSHQPIRFETAQSWNPGCGKIPDNNGTEPKGGHPVGSNNPGNGHKKGHNNGIGHIGKDGGCP